MVAQDAQKGTASDLLAAAVMDHSPHFRLKKLLPD